MRNSAPTPAPAPAAVQIEEEPTRVRDELARRGLKSAAAPKKRSASRRKDEVAPIALDWQPLRNE